MQTENVLYADILFLVDFSMDYLSLFAAARLLSLPARLPRTALAAAAGGLYGVFAVAGGITGFFSGVLAVAVSAVMTLIAFGVPSDGWAWFRAVATVWGSGALLGGVMTALSGAFGGVYPGQGFDFLFAGTAMLLGLIRPVRRSLTRGYAEVEIPSGGRLWRGRALIDSGNLLTDPISGVPVLLMRSEEARMLLGALTDTLYRGETENVSAGVRAVPVRTADGTRILYGFFVRELTLIRGRRRLRRSAVVCVDHGADGYGGCAVLLPAALLL